MNKRQILASLNDAANELDNMNLYSEANILTNVMRKIANLSDDSMESPNDFMDSSIGLDSSNTDMTGEKSPLSKYIDGLNDIFKTGGHSGFSAQFVRNHILMFAEGTEESKESMLEEFRNKVQNPDMNRMNAKMDKEILRALQYTANFQTANNLSDKELLGIVNKA